MGRVYAKFNRLTVHAKLLLLLIALSLPLLIVSAWQIRSYRRAIDDQTAQMASLETAAAVNALGAWLNERDDLLAPSAETLAALDAHSLYSTVRRRAALAPDVALTIYDDEGRVVLDPVTGRAAAPADFADNYSVSNLITSPVAQVARRRWSDGATLITGVAREESRNWRVAIGFPPVENTPAGHSMLMIAVTWATTLLCTLLLGVWAVGRFTRPLQRLAASAGALGGDRLPSQIAVETRDEIGKLASSFNSIIGLLQAKVDELENVINQMEEGVVIVDARGRYRVNDAALRIIGVEREKLRDGVQALLVDMNVRDSEGRPLASMETPLGRALVYGERVVNERIKILRGGRRETAGAKTDGAAEDRERVLSVSATPLRDARGRRAGIVGVFRDITDEVRQAEAMRVAYERLREHDRLKSAFVANISHELRTPLNVILGLCQLLARDKSAPLTSVQREAINRMSRNARSLLQNINDLITYSRLDAGYTKVQTARVNIAEVVARIVSKYEPEACAKELTLKAEVAPELSRVMTDRAKFSEALENLVSNAVKFTNQGEVTITAGLLPNAVGSDAQDGAQNEFADLGAHKEAHWFVEVADTGIGIASEALAFIFDPFRQVDDKLSRAYGGVGLGLAITRKLVALLGGEVSVTSRPQEGSRFRLTFPLAQDAATPTIENDASEEDGAPPPPSQPDSVSYMTASRSA